MDKILEKAIKFVKIYAISNLIGEDKEVLDIELRVISNAEVDDRREIVILVTSPVRSFFRVLVRKTDTNAPAFQTEVFNLYDSGAIYTS